jgi:DUF1680 family protein
VKKPSGLNFRRAAGEEGEFVGLFFNDSDVYKWPRGRRLKRRHQRFASIADHCLSVVADIVSAQRSDGYLNSYFSKARSDERLNGLTCTKCTVRAPMQAAVAIYRANGDRVALDAACGMADHIDATFRRRARQTPYHRRSPRNRSGW